MMAVRLFVAATVLLVFYFQGSDGAFDVVTEYCQWESFNATCGPHEVILMRVARYGRMKLGRCLRKGYGVVGCAADVTAYVDSHCSGRRRCQINVADIALEGIRPCSEELSAYMEAAYICVSAFVPQQTECRRHQHFRLEAPSGYISNGDATGITSSYSCPWRLKALPGQRVNITMYDFSVFTRPGDRTSSVRKLSVCKRYATITENPGSRETPICGGVERVRTVYISDGNEVDVRLMRHDVPGEQVHFLVHYTAVGCPHLPPTNRNTRVEFTSQSMTVTCNVTGEKWYLTCRGNKWIGHIGNCSKAAEGGIWAVLIEEWTSPYGVLVIVGLGVTLGIALGVVLLLCAVFIIRRNTSLCSCMRMSQPHPPAAVIGLKADDPTHYTGTSRHIHNKSHGHITTEDDYATRAWLSQRPLPDPEEEADLLGLCNHAGDERVFRQGGNYPMVAVPVPYPGGNVINYNSTVTCSAHRVGVPHVYESPQSEHRNIIFVDT